MPSFLVAAPASGSGKTVTTVGILAALRAAGHTVAPAKVGPDYIDTAYLSAAAGRPAVNLDAWAMRDGLLSSLAAREGLVVEGVMGLFDGPSSGVGSSADVARRFGLPVVLVISAERQSHSVAALAHGFATFDPSINVAGVLLTKVASARHEAMLGDALRRASIPLFGAIPRSDDLALPSRHLGLTQACEHKDLSATIAAARHAVAAHCDLAALAALTAAPPAPSDALPALPPLGQRIAIAQDAAFAFAYAHILDGWAQAGATLHPFSPLAGEPPDAAADAVFLPGGYPELHAAALAAEPAWREGLAKAAARGALIYGECGGYMALGQALIDGEGAAHPMAALLPVTTDFSKPSRTLGYRRLTHDGTLLPRHLRGHEFHYATVAAEGTPMFDAQTTDGAAIGPMGTRVGRVAGSFAHIIDRTDAMEPA